MEYSKKSLDFFQMVYQVCREIPEGRVTTYGAIAKSLSASRSSRMVGWAMNGAHHQKEYVPAHRVVNRKGMLTGKIHFKTPFEMEKLLALEDIKVENDIVVDFKELFWDPSIELAL